MPQDNEVFNLWCPLCMAGLEKCACHLLSDGIWHPQLLVTQLIPMFFQLITTLTKLVLFDYTCHPRILKLKKNFQAYHVTSCCSKSIALILHWNWSTIINCQNDTYFVHVQTKHILCIHFPPSGYLLKFYLHNLSLLLHI